MGKRGGVEEGGTVTEDRYLSSKHGNDEDIHMVMIGGGEMYQRRIEEN